MRNSVGIRELRDKLSATIEKVRRGEAITVTDRRRPVAMIVPLRRGADDVLDVVRQLARAGSVKWSGGKPAGCRTAPTVSGRSVGAAVTEDRR